MKKWVIMVLILAVGVFTFQNIRSVTVHFLLWQISMSGVFLYLFLFLLGMLAGYLLCLIRAHR